MRVENVKHAKVEEFDNILGFCLGENHWCDYIEGDTSFICVIAGFHAAELTPKYPDFISERVYALHAAARWWYEYRQDALLLNNVYFPWGMNNFSRKICIFAANNKRTHYVRDKNSSKR